MPFLQQFQPDLIIVSAGYDANREERIAQISLEPNDFGVLTENLLTITSSIFFGLEGGYELDSLGKSVVATVSACLTCFSPANPSKKKCFF